MNKVPGLNSNVFFDPVGLPFSQVESDGFPSGAIAYYKLDNTTGDAIDSVAGTYNMTVDGVTRGVAGIIGNAFQFDGLVDYTFVESAPITDVLNDDWTVSWWTVTANNSNGVQLGQFDSSGIASLFEFKLQHDIGGGIPRLSLITRNEAFTIISYSFDLSIGEDTGLCTVTREGTDIKFYYNGILKSTQTYDLSGTFILDRFSIGGRIRNTPITLGNLTDSTIDEVGIWDRALSATEISNLYNGGNGRQI